MKQFQYLQSSVVGKEKEGDRYWEHKSDSKAFQAGADLE